MPEAINQTSVNPAISPNTSQTSADQVEAGKFNARNVSINHDAELPPVAKAAEGSLQESTSLQERDVTTPGEAQSFSKVSESLAFGHISNMTNYLANSAATGDIPSDMTEDMVTAIEFAHQSHEDTNRIANLFGKLNDGVLTKSEKSELDGLMSSNQYNQKLVSSWLFRKEIQLEKAGTLTPQAKNLLGGLQMRLANSNMAIADMSNLFDYENMAPLDSVSRSDRLNAHLIQAGAALDVAESLAKTETTPEKKNVLNAMVSVLREQHSMIGQAKYMEDNPTQPTEAMIDPNRKLKTVNKELWDDAFTLTTAGKGKEKSIEALQKGWEQKLQGNDRSGRWIPLSKPGVAQNRMSTEFMKFMLKKANVFPKGKMPDLKFMMKEANNKVINAQRWDPVLTEVKYSVPQERGQDIKRTAYSNITPGQAMQKHFETPYESNGVNCSDRVTQYEHVPNLAHTSLRDEDGKVLFSGLRHGILDPYELTGKGLPNLSDAELHKMVSTLLAGTEHLSANPSAEEVGSIINEIRTNPEKASSYAKQMRPMASDIMARELVSAAVITDTGKFQSALNGDTVDLSMSSISLVTPDYLRKTFSGSGSNEQAMLNHQTAALKKLENMPQPVTLKVRDQNGELKDIKVNVKIRTFNFGVNKGGVGSLVKHLLPVRRPLVNKLMGWGLAMKQNDPELMKLVGNEEGQTVGGEVGRKANGLRNDAQKLIEERIGLVGAGAHHSTPEVVQIDMQITALQEEAAELEQAGGQVKSMWLNGSYMKGGQEPYKMVSRLAHLTNMIDDTTAFNCKSGKDRTGQLDAEAKYIAAITAADGKLPEVETVGLRGMRGAFTMNTGNLEMQKLTTGLPGFKLKGVAGLKNVIADQSVLPAYRGGSAFVKA
ncbi:MAG: inositol phosphate phosphatase SopB [Candidatus Oxydemutatoraceae bacterium WSBS_2016_MAG_OTU14]